MARNASSSDKSEIRYYADNGSYYYKLKMTFIFICIYIVTQSGVEIIINS